MSSGDDDSMCPTSGFLSTNSNEGFVSRILLMVIFQKESLAIGCYDHVCLSVGFGTTIEPESTSKAIFFLVKANDLGKSRDD